jgi:(S)-mandelate dehydrogenase
MAADLARAYNIEDLRRLPRMVFDFYDGGAEDEVTLRGNRAAIENLRLAPRVLRDVSHVDTGCEILGAPAKLPMVIAPTGGAGFSWPGGDLAIARAARAIGIPCTLSTSTTATVEQIAEHAGGRRGGRGRGGRTACARDPLGRAGAHHAFVRRRLDRRHFCGSDRALTQPREVD